LGAAPGIDRSGIGSRDDYSLCVTILSFGRVLRLLAGLCVAAVVAAGCSSAGQQVTAAGADEDSAQPVIEQAESDESTAVDSNGSAAAELAAQDEELTVASTTSTTTAPTTTTTTTTTIAPTTTTAPPTARECAAQLPLDVRIGQLLFPLLTQDEFAQAEALAANGHLGGIVVLGSPDSGIAANITSLQNQSPLGPLIVAVDEEGGRVQRLAPLVGAQPSARAVATNDDLATARQRADDHAVALGELGFTMNLAPVVDLDTGIFIGDRSYGSDPEVVSQYALAVADGIIDGGLTPVVKHFPGHGSGVDSHTGLPTIPAVEELRTEDLIPFERAIARGDLPIMIGHLVVPGLTDGRPATLSAAAIDGLLRGELGFDGLVMTDALNMDAIAATTTNAEAAELAIGAGVDLVMLGSLDAVEGTVARIGEAVSSGRLTDEQITSSFLRVLDERGLEVCSLPGDLSPAIGCEAGSEACR